MTDDATAPSQEPHAVPTTIARRRLEQSSTGRRRSTWCEHPDLDPADRADLVFGLPLVFMIVSSFKPDLQIFADLTSVKAFLPVGDLVPGQLRRGVRPGAVRHVPDQLGDHHLGARSALGLIVNSMAAFALSRIQFRGQKVDPRRHPGHADRAVRDMALPLLWWVNKLPYFDFVNGFTQGWLDTYQVQIVPFIANAFSIFLFYQYFDSIPKALDEAATVDGAGWFRIYRSIDHAAVRTGDRDGGDPDLPPGLEPVPVAADGGPDRGAAPGHGRHRLLQAAQRLLGPDHGLRHA